MGPRTNYRDLSKEPPFGRLKAIEDTGDRTTGGHVIWLCKCRCKRKVKVVSINLTSGNTRSCGCYRKESSYATGGSRTGKV
jgi:hypothetical protein